MCPRSSREKTFHFWEAEQFANDPRRDEFLRGAGASLIANPRELLDSSLVARVGPGDILYWPSSYWHVGLGDGGRPHGGITLGFWDRRYHSRELAKLVEEVVRASLGPQDVWEGYFQPKGSEPPPPVRQALQVLEAAVRNGELERQMKDAWAAQVSADWFRIKPTRSL
jgi:50S ribosomal protein L16 3-hydroxylase